MTRRLTTVARELQSASNRLALANRNQSRDTVLAGLYAGQAKGSAAASRLESGAIVLRALERDVKRLRKELGEMLDALDNESRQTA